MADKLWNDPKFKKKMDKEAQKALADSKAGKKPPKPKAYPNSKEKKTGK